jgi:hypothetical protein
MPRSRSSIPITSTDAPKLEVTSPTLLSQTTNHHLQQTTASRDGRRRSDRSLGPEERAGDTRRRSRGRSCRRSLTPEIIRLRRFADIRTESLLYELRKPLDEKDKQLAEKQQQLKQEREGRERSRERAREKFRRLQRQNADECGERIKDRLDGEGRKGSNV